MIYLLYMMVKYTLPWIVIALKDSGDFVRNSVSSTYRMIATYEGTPFLCNFLIYLYNTCYMASSVMDTRHAL